MATNEETTEDSRNVFLEKDSEIFMGEASNQQGNPKKNGNTKNAFTQNQEKSPEIIQTHNEGEQLRKHNTFGAYCARIYRVTVSTQLFFICNINFAFGPEPVNMTTLGEWVADQCTRGTVKLEKLLMATRDKKICNSMSDYLLKGRGTQKKKRMTFGDQ